jgi:hypothetical protein
VAFLGPKRQLPGFIKPCIPTRAPKPPVGPQWISLLTNKRRPILTLLEDTSGGIHDTLMVACDRYRYELLEVSGYHDNCTDNLAAALSRLGFELPRHPALSISS